MKHLHWQMVAAIFNTLPGWNNRNEVYYCRGSPKTTR
jgi:hypothetical protein